MKFKKSKEMLRKEFDIVTILKRMRKFTLLNNIMLTKGQRTLMKYLHFVLIHFLLHTLKG